MEAVGSKLADATLLPFAAECGSQRHGMSTPSYAAWFSTDTAPAAVKNCLSR
jgi:hypothetical protein